MANKIFITGSHSVDKLKIAKLLVQKDDSLSICKKFTSNPDYKGVISDNYIYFLESQEIDLAYKNNVLLYVNTENYISSGITIDNYYNDDIFVLDLRDFNNISNTVFQSTLNEIIVIWIDSPITSNSPEIKQDINETKYLLERLNSGVKYLYFLSETEDFITDTILEYLNGDEETKNKLLEENS